MSLLGSLSLGLLSSLTHLEFSGLGFPPNAIPLELGNTPLQRFIVAYNPLEGTLPSALGRLGQLKFLQLTSSSFTGTIPAAIGVAPPVCPSYPRPASPLPQGT